MLIVDDQPLVREAVVSVFEGEPEFSVTQAGSVGEARQVLEGADVVILDLRLPDGRGTDLIQQLYTVNPQAKVVVFSSSIDPADASEARKHGAVAAINKLDGFDQLLATVRDLLRQTGS